MLPNISKSKGNQTMEFGQLIEYNMRSIFLGKSYTKCDERIFDFKNVHNFILKTTWHKEI